MSSALFFARKLSRRERIRLFFSWAYIRQTPPFYRLTIWWINRGN